MKKIVHPYNIKYSGMKRHVPVFVKITISGGRLTIAGVVNPNRHGGAYACGQLDRDLLDDIIDADSVQYSKGWDIDMVTKLVEVWERWHLNDIRAGTQRQEDALRGKNMNYTEQLEYLRSIGLEPDTEYIREGKPYSYGSGLTEPLPQDVINWLSSLPDTDKTPAWI